MMTTQTHITVEYDGFRWDLRLPSNIDSEIAAGRRYDADMYSWCEQYVKPGMTVADVGANFGCFTLPLSRMVGPTGHVHAYEPERNFYARLVRHILANKIENVTTYPFALLHENMTTRLVPNGPPYYSSAALTLSDDPHCGDGAHRVSCMAMDNVWTSDRLDFLKIDVDFTEHLTLKGAARTSGKCRPTIAIEIALTDDGVTAAKLLAEWGYRLSTARHAHVTPQDIAAMDRRSACTVNVLALPKEKQR